MPVGDHAVYIDTRVAPVLSGKLVTAGKSQARYVRVGYLQRFYGKVGEAGVSVVVIVNKIHP